MNDNLSTRIEKNSRRNFIFRVIIVAIALLVVLHFTKVLDFIKSAFNVSLPFLFGLGLAYIWNLLLRPMEKVFFPNSKKPIVQKIKRPVCVFLSLIVILAIIALVFYLVLPQIYKSIMVIGENIPSLAERLQAWFLRVTEDFEWANQIRTRVENMDVNWQQYATRAWDVIKSGIGGVIGSTFSLLNNILGLVISVFTALIFTIYTLFDKEKLKLQMDRLTEAYIKEKHRHRHRLVYFLNILDDTYSNFFKGQLLSAFIIGALLFVVLLIFRMPYALTIGIVVMVTALIPMLGAFIGGAVGFLMIAAVNLQQAWLFLVLLIVVQQLEGDLIYPKIVGNSIGLPGMWVFVAVIAGGAIAGPIGMILCVPLAAAVYKIIKHDVTQRIALDSHFMEVDTDKMFDDK